MLLSSFPEEIGARTLLKPEVVLYIHGQLCFSLSVLFLRSNNVGRLQTVLELSSTNASLNMLSALSSSHDCIWVWNLIHYYLMLPDLLQLFFQLFISSILGGISCHTIQELHNYPHKVFYGWCQFLCKFCPRRLPCHFFYKRSLKLLSLLENFTLEVIKYKIYSSWLFAPVNSK